MTCDCGERMTGNADSERETLLGFASQPGHNHNDNCLTRNYVCPNGHVRVVAIRRRCDVEGCTWKGKEECPCHSGKKVEEWPT